MSAMSGASFDRELFGASSGGSRVWSGNHTLNDPGLWVFQETSQNGRFGYFSVGESQAVLKLSNCPICLQLQGHLCMKGVVRVSLERMRSSPKPVGVIKFLEDQYQYRRDKVRFPSRSTRTDGRELGHAAR